MIRFTMPDRSLPQIEQIQALREQFNFFLRSPALEEILSLLNVDQYTVRQVYNGRRMPDGRIRETQELEPLNALEEHRRELYPLLQELGFFSINTPLLSQYSHVLVLGGSLNACFARTRCASQWVSASTRCVDGLTCYRPLNPKEREGFPGFYKGDTEFSAMTDSFIDVFRLSADDIVDDFYGNGNLNLISCIRAFQHRTAPEYRVYAAPSMQPKVRRADTGDSILFYLREADLLTNDRILAVTNNRYCNRQFVQMVYHLMKESFPVYIDVIGCTPDEQIIGRDTYDPFQFLQDLIGVLDWIDRFERDL